VSQQSTEPVQAAELLGPAGLSPGIGYPILHRLCSRGLLCRHWEDIDPPPQAAPRLHSRLSHSDVARCNIRSERQLSAYNSF